MGPSLNFGFIWNILIPVHYQLQPLAPRKYTVLLYLIYIMANQEMPKKMLACQVLQVWLNV